MKIDKEKSRELGYIVSTINDNGIRAAFLAWRNDSAGAWCWSTVRDEVAALNPGAVFTAVARGNSDFSRLLRAR